MKMVKDPYFKPSVKVDFTQIVIIVLVLAIIAAVPFIISFVRSGGSSSIADVISETLESFKLTTDSEVDPRFVLTIPILNTDIHLTILKQNPQLLIYGGLAFISFSIVVGVSLIRSLMKE